MLFFFVIFFTLQACCYRGGSGTLSITSPNANTAKANARMALDDLKKGYTDTAQERVNLALQQAPYDPVILDIAGYYYEKTGDIDTANRYFFAAVLYAPKSKNIRNNYGAFLCRNGYYAESLKYFNTGHYSETQNMRENAQYCRAEMQRALGAQTIYDYYISQLGQAN